MLCIYSYVRRKVPSAIQVFVCAFASRLSRFKIHDCFITSSHHSLPLIVNKAQKTKSERDYNFSNTICPSYPSEGDVGFRARHDSYPVFLGKRKCLVRVDDDLDAGSLCDSSQVLFAFQKQHQSQTWSTHTWFRLR